MSAIRSTYRVGFAHGFALGTLGTLPREPYVDPRWATLDKQYSRGLVVALQRPALFVEAFDQKCGDYRNRGLRLTDVGLLVVLELGGVANQSIERAFEIARSGGEKERVIEALLQLK